ncbi:SDR family NAD(P)-dependent oxidoreductase [Neisseria sp. ZJ106]|uniref:SDR family NAD(P)-dependent oxidoreductase n=1 Tax=Neisseria lisongii TaxID=2912188 RepID=A0ABY7RLC5_9NEIS|nr:NAD-dependent epimerase/dehydratase family protein [Neisseria lisongii]MCF7521093.1 SDR family NAD(P)-dependent oxidoreductase [Neisseria lisongii]WCL72018.1 SDR family NAD(P)-dependent oxidoreductase [Neisseria lisongii]
MTPVPDCGVFGLGYLGRPLAQKCYEHGSRVRALKRSLTSDDINLPVALDIADLNQADVFSHTFWQHWRQHPTWFFLLPPSSCPDYAGLLGKVVRLAETLTVRHLIFSSSTSVYGDSVRLCDETSPTDPQTESAHKIAAAEQLLLAADVPHIDIIRLGGLYSARRHPVSRLAGKTKLKGGKQPVNLIHEDEAVRTLFQTALNPNGKRIKNAVAAEHPPRAVFYRSEAAKLGIPLPEFDESDSGGGKIVNTVSEYGLSL